jgi:hypothetical protein
MLSKCANPACDAKLHYLRQGKIFRIDTESLAFADRRAKPVVPAIPEDLQLSRCISNLQVVADRGGMFRPEYFWLCAECSQDWTIAVSSGSVMVIPVSRQLALHAAAS